MTFIGFDELYPNRNYPKMKEYIQEKAYDKQQIIKNFLLNGNVEAARLSRVKDVFSGETIPREVLVMHHGDYRWSNVLAWYVEKYNLRMPEDFERYILEHSG